MTEAVPHSLSLRKKVAHVLDGKTVAGLHQHAPITYPRNPGRFSTLLRWTDQFLTQRPDATEDELTAVIRKLALFIIRRGRDDYFPEEIIDGLAWFASHPETISSKLGFGSAARLGRDEHIHRLREKARRARAVFRADMRVPERAPVVWAHAGGFTLSELVHPHHLLSIGGRAGNCLAGPRLASGYWLRIAEGRGKLFTITQGELLCGLFLLRGPDHVEWSYVHTPDGVWDFISHCVALLDQRLGQHSGSGPYIPRQYRCEEASTPERQCKENDEI